MDRSCITKVRGYPRVFIPTSPVLNEEYNLPKDTYKRLHDVLRLSKGELFCALPNDGTFWLMEYHGKLSVPIERIVPQQDNNKDIVLCIALLKGDKLEQVISICTELGVRKFVLFSASRSVMRWDANKVDAKLSRLHGIAQESCLVSVRSKSPEIEYLPSLKAVMDKYPNAKVLNESDRVETSLDAGDKVCLVVGPEGGWAPQDLPLIQDKSYTLGNHVLRADTAAIYAVSVIS